MFVANPVHCRDLQAVFDAFGGGTKHLTSTNAIKEELMDNGPVVSTSFVPPTLSEFVSSSSRYVVNKSFLKKFVTSWPKEKET
jgi:hypothetical protein